MSPLRAHVLLALVPALWIGGARTAEAEQIVVFDQTWVHTPDLADSHFRMPPAPEAPGDWTSPVDYSGGSAWVYLEVHTKPTEQETKFQVCFEATPTYACTNQSPTYTTVGTYEWETPFSDFWSPPGEFVDWTQGVHDIACILKDTMNNKPSADNVGPEMAALYTPTEVRLVVTLVEPGSVYVPPTPTGDTGTGSEGGSSGAADSSGGEGGDSTGPIDPTSPGGSSGGPTSAGDTSATSAASSGAAGESSDTGGAPADDASGCGCRSDRPDAAGGLVLLVALGHRRARRRSA